MSCINFSEPLPPNNVEITGRTTTSIILDIDGPNNGSYDGINITANGLEFHFNSTGPFILNNLTPGTNYTIFVFSTLDMELSDAYARPLSHYTCKFCSTIISKI